jgi:hypothetical protein
MSLFIGTASKTLMPNPVSFTKPVLEVATTALHSLEHGSRPLAEKLVYSAQPHHYPQDLKRAALFGLATMATKLPGSFYRRFVDDGTAPDIIKQIDNKRELILQSLCLAIGTLMDYLVNPKIAATFPKLFKNPMCKAFMMVPCLFMAEGVSRLLAGQKKDLYQNAFGTAGTAPNSQATATDFRVSVRPLSTNTPLFSASSMIGNPFVSQAGPSVAFKAFVA